jgi:hypothetical protein
MDGEAIKKMNDALKEAFKDMRVCACGPLCRTPADFADHVASVEHQNAFQKKISSIVGIRHG